jgi:hypothetical protein
VTPSPASPPPAPSPSPAPPSIPVGGGALSPVWQRTGDGLSNEPQCCVDSTCQQVALLCLTLHDSGSILVFFFILQFVYLMISRTLSEFECFFSETR